MEPVDKNDIEKGSITSKRIATLRDNNRENDEKNSIKKKNKFSSTIHKYITKRSSALDQVDNDGEKRSIDAVRIQSSLRDAVLYSYGILAAEVFVYEEKGDGDERVKIPRLEQPKGGWYCDPHYRSAISSFCDGLDTDNVKKSGALARLEDSTREDYIPPGPVTPGVDLAGVLWSQYGGRSTSTIEVHNVSSSSSRSVREIFQARSLRHNKNDQCNKQTLSTQKDKLHQQHHIQHMSSSLPFRDLGFLLNDPDTAKSGPRLEALINAGFENALAIPFRVGEYSGIVIYYARANVMKDRRVSSMENSSYLHKSADIIGLMVSSVDSRRASVLMKHEICADVCQRVCKEMATTGGCSCHRKTEEEKQPSQTSLAFLQQSTDFVEHKTVTYVRKCWYGGGNQIPPPMPLLQTIYTWIGSFLGLLLLSGMNELSKDYSNNDYSLLIGPFGAMMTLMYGLTSAPASQPRNVILGQAIAGAISLCFTYIPEENLSVWVRTALGPAFSITTMVALGIPHPPAGAHAVLYASGDYDWIYYLLVVIGSIISVFPATLINNLSKKRQYPTYWGYWTNYLPGEKGCKKVTSCGENSTICCGQKTSCEGGKKVAEENEHVKCVENDVPQLNPKSS